MSIVLDLTGKKFGKWKVIERAENTKRGSSQWLCECTGCRRKLVVTSGNLRSGRSSACQQCVKRLPEGEASFRSLFREYRQNARDRGYSFLLSLKRFRQLTSDLCHYCGAPPAQIWIHGQKTYGFYTYNGVDRKDNSKGYTITNSVSCCGICNKAKRITPYQEYIDWIRRSYQWLQKTST